MSDSDQDHLTTLGCSVQPGNFDASDGSLRCRVADGLFHGVTADAGVKSRMIWASMAGWSRGMSV
jgi:hypothetical protein